MYLLIYFILFSNISVINVINHTVSVIFIPIWVNGSRVTIPVIIYARLYHTSQFKVTTYRYRLMYHRKNI